MPLLGLLNARAKKLGDTEISYRGCVGADPIGEYAKSGKSASMPICYRQMASAIRWTQANMPAVKTIFINASVYHNAGANAVQEVAVAMATAVAYLDALLEQGFSVDEVAGQMRFGFSVGANFFMEIAKLRAARTVWAQIIQAYGGSKEAAKIDIAARTSQFTTTVYDPYVNILRATTQTFSAVVGGVNTMTVTPFDAAVRESDAMSRRTARNLQVMMQNEFDLLSPVDPAGGSWYVETLTGELAEAIWAELQKIDAKGGILAVLEDASLQEAIATVLAERLQKLATRVDRAVGSNMYPNMQEKPLVKTDAKTAAKKTGKPLQGLENDIDSVTEAFLQGAVADEVYAALCREEAPAIRAMAAHRWTEQFEALRAATEKYIAETGKNVKVFLCNMGPIPQHKARADFSASFMEVAHFEVLRNNGFATVEEAVAAAAASGADVAVICSTDDTYPELVPDLAQGIKAAVPKMKVILAGAPAPDMKESYATSGVDEYIHVKANCLQILTDIQKERGIRA